MVIHKVKIPGNNNTTNKNARTKLIDFGIELHRVDIEFNLPHSTLNLNQNANANVTHAYTNRQMTPVKKCLRIKSLDASGAIGMHLLHDDHNVNVNVSANMNMNDNDTGSNRMGMILTSNNYELIGINNESCRNLSRKRIEAILVKEGAGAGAGAGDVILLIKEHGNMGMDNNTYRKGRGYGNNKKNKPLATDCCRCSQSGDCCTDCGTCCVIS